MPPIWFQKSTVYKKSINEENSSLFMSSKDKNEGSNFKSEKSQDYSRKLNEILKIKKIF